MKETTQTLTTVMFGVIWDERQRATVRVRRVLSKAVSVDEVKRESLVKRFQSFSSESDMYSMASRWRFVDPK